MLKNQSWKAHVQKNSATPELSDMQDYEEPLDLDSGHSKVLRTDPGLGAEGGPEHGRAGKQYGFG
jgi:hypothetical protein